MSAALGFLVDLLPGRPALTAPLRLD